MNKKQLDLAATIFGTIAGFCTILITQDVGNRKIVGVVGGASTLALGVITQRSTNKHPTTEETEDAEVQRKIQEEAIREYLDRYFPANRETKREDLGE